MQSLTVATNYQLLIVYSQRENKENDAFKFVMLLHTIATTCHVDDIEHVEML